MSQREDHDPQYLTVRELARRWHMARSTVYGLLEQCQLPYTKLGNSLRVKLADVEAYEQAGRVEAIPLSRALRLLPRQRQAQRRRRPR